MAPTKSYTGFGSCNLTLAPAELEETGNENDANNTLPDLMGVTDFDVSQSLLGPPLDVHEAQRSNQNPIQLSMINEVQNSIVNNSKNKKNTNVLTEAYTPNKRQKIDSTKSDLGDAAKAIRTRLENPPPLDLDRSFGAYVASAMQGLEEGRKRNLQLNIIQAINTEWQA